MQAVDLVVEPSHRRRVDLVGEPVEDAAERRVPLQGFATDERDGLIGGEEAAVVLEHDKVERDDPPIGRVARGQVERATRHGLVEQVAVHLARGVGKIEVVGPDQARIAVGAVHELGAETGADRVEVVAEVGDCPDAKLLGLCAAHQERKRVLEAERVEAAHPVATFKGRADPVEHSAWVVVGGLVEDGRQGGPGVLDVGIKPPPFQGVKADERPPQVEPSIHPERGLRLDQVGEHVAQQDHLAAVLRADHDRLDPGAIRLIEPPAPGRQREQGQDGRNGEDGADARVSRPGRIECAFDLAERRVAGQGQQRRRDRPEQDQSRVRQGHAPVDVAAEPFGPDRRGDGRHADRGHGRDPHAPEDDRHGQRKLYDPEPLPGRHPQPDRRLGHPSGYAPQPEDRVLDDRQESIDDQCRHRRLLADLAAEDDQQEPEQGQARDRLEDVGQPHDGPLGPSRARRQDAQRHPDEHRDQERLDHEVEVRGGGGGQRPTLGPEQVEPGTHRPTPGPSPSTASASRKNVRTKSVAGRSISSTAAPYCTNRP